MIISSNMVSEDRVSLPPSYPPPRSEFHNREGRALPPLGSACSLHILRDRRWRLDAATFPRRLRREELLVTLPPASA
jgi:hypothetical protein